MQSLRLKRLNTFFIKLNSVDAGSMASSLFSSIPISADSRASQKAVENFERPRPRTSATVSTSHDFLIPITRNPKKIF